MIVSRLALVITLAPSAAFAQQAPPAPSPAKPGPTVVVQDNKGAETKGKLLLLDVREAGGVAECGDHTNPVVAAASAAAIGGAIGAGIDALRVGRTTLYQTPTGTAALELRPTSMALRVRW